MAVKQITYVIEIDTANGKVKIDGLTNGFVKAETAAKRLNETLTETTANTGQAASKMGLAGATITELGRTISDSNYGMTAMANNLQQLSTLFVTLISTTGGFKQAMALMTKAALGPLGIILIFQTIFSLFERVAINSRQTGVELEKQKKTIGDIKKETVNLNDEVRKRLNLEEDIADEMERQVAAKRLEAETELIMRDIRLEGLREELRKAEDIRAGLIDMGMSTEQTDQAIANLKDLIARTEKEIIQFRQRMGGGGDPTKPDPLPLVEIWTDKDLEQAEIQFEAFKNVLGDFTDVQIEAELLTTKVHKEEVDKRIFYSKLEAEQRRILMESIGDGMISLGVILGRETEAGKHIAAAGALINTYAAIAGQLKAFAGVPIPGYAIAQAVATGLFGFAQVAEIYRVNTRGRNSGTAAGGGTQVTEQITPSFNVIGQTGTSQLRETVEGALDRPLRAYVVQKDVRSGEELDRNTRRGATIG